MTYDGKAEIVFLEGNSFPLMTGYSLATVFRINPKTFNTYELLNFGYCPAIKKFYFNRNITIPMEAVKKFQEMEISKDSEKIMLEYGLFSYNDVDMLLTNYENANQHFDICRYKLLNLKKVLKKDDK